MNRETPKHGEIWKHFKNNYYYIICIGHHSETQEKMVVYKRLYIDEFADGDHKFDYTELSKETCIRPLDMFLSKVDKTKYPDCNQTYRFELQNIKSVNNK